MTETGAGRTGPDQVETASWLRRILALCVDWAACTFVLVLFVDYGHPMFGFFVLGAYVVENTLFTAVLRGSFGQLLTGLRVVRYGGDPRPVGLLPALVRSVLIALVVPPLIFRPDGRGLHDMITGTVTVPVAILP